MNGFSCWACYVALLCGVLSVPSLAAQAEEITEARALMKEGKHKEAFMLLREEITDERLAEDPAFMLVVADAAWRYAPDIPILNGGDKLQDELYAEAGKIYRDVIALESASEAQKKHARQEIKALMGWLKDQGTKALDQNHLAIVLRYFELMNVVSPDNYDGLLYIVALGKDLKDDRITLYGLQLLVKAKPKQLFVYTSAAKLEADPKIGRGPAAALAHLEAGLEVLPDNADLQYEQIKFLMKLQRKDDAIKALGNFEKTQATRIKYKKVLADMTLTVAAIYGDLGQIDEAVARYEQVIAEFPKSLIARVGLGMVHFGTGLEAHTKLINPDNKIEEVEAAILRTRVNLSFDKARPHLEYYHKNAPEPNLIVMQSLSHIYRRFGDDDKRQKMLNDIEKVEKDEKITR
ncbi:MAG: hypothetical protein AAF085_02600 [Planctomycetota bacterium]